MTSTQDQVTAALLDRRVTQLEQQMAGLVADRDRALRWGVLTLGAALLSLITWIANHLKGITP